MLYFHFCHIQVNHDKKDHITYMYMYSNLFFKIKIWQTMCQLHVRYMRYVNLNRGKFTTWLYYIGKLTTWTFKARRHFLNIVCLMMWEMGWEGFLTPPPFLALLQYKHRQSITLYTDLFSWHFFFHPLHLQMVLPDLEFAQTMNYIW